MRNHRVGAWTRERGVAGLMASVVVQTCLVAVLAAGAAAQTPTPMVSCPPAPAAGCTEPARSSFKFLDRFANGRGVKDKVIWRFLGGPPQPRSDFGDPTSTTDYALCIYADSTLTMEGFVQETTSCSPMGLCCGPCWRAKGSELYLYTYRATSAIGKVTLRGAGTKPRTTIVLKSGWAGFNYTAATLPFSASAIAVRFHNSDNGNCWGADFPLSSFQRNDEEYFTAAIP